MERNPLKWPIGCLGGLLVIVFYCLLTLASVVLYPHPFSPAANYLSDLGNWANSPVGAFFYNAGCVLTGTALFTFYYGLLKWYTYSKWRNLMVQLTQVIGFMSAASLILVGIYSEDAGRMHGLASTAFFALNFIALILLNTSLLTHPKFIREIALYGYAVTALSLIFYILARGPLVEWFTVFTALAFVGLLVINMLTMTSTSMIGSKRKPM